MLFGWDNYNYNYNYNYKDDAVPMDVDSNALAHDHNYGKVSLSIELRKNAFFHFMVITMKYAFLKKAGDDGDDGDPEDEEAQFPCDPPSNATITYHLCVTSVTRDSVTWK